MKLTEVHNLFNSDKGKDHNYINVYETLFEGIRLKKMNVLEIGVLFGDSLKLWEYYFENSIIYGIDNFVVRDGHAFHNYKKVENEKIKEILLQHNRIIFYDMDCENEILAKEKFSDIKFNIIIDDASHKLTQQKKNYSTYYEYLTDDGIYICEDVQSKEIGLELCDYIKKITPTKNIEMFELNVKDRSDDRLVVVK